MKNRFLRYLPIYLNGLFILIFSFVIADVKLTDAVLSVLIIVTFIWYNITNR
jgi:hypothetical protein